MSELRDVSGYERWYTVSSDGRVFSKGRVITKSNGVRMTYHPKEIRQCDNGRGYMTVMLYGENGGKRMYVHRLVAEAFLSNERNLPQINHKDENRKNNSVSNLEWCDAKYNLEYGSRSGRVTRALSKPVLQVSKSGKVIARFLSAMEAGRRTGIRQGSISHCCNKERKTAGGYRWEFEEERNAKEEA